MPARAHKPVKAQTGARDGPNVDRDGACVQQLPGHQPKCAELVRRQRSSRMAAVAALSPTASYTAERYYTVDNGLPRALRSRLLRAFLALTLVPATTLPRPMLGASDGQSTIAPAGTRSFFVAPGE